MSKWFLPLLIVSIIVCCIEVEVSVPGFPDIARSFHASESLIELTVGLNFLGFWLSALFYGPLSHILSAMILSTFLLMPFFSSFEKFAKE